MDTSQIINCLTIYPAGFFTLFFCLFLIYWVVGVIAGLDQSLGFDFGDAGHGDGGFFSNVFVTMGLSKIPLTIGLSITSFIGMVISSVLQIKVLSLFFSYDENFNPFSILYVGSTTVVVFFTLIVSLWLAGRVVKPLIPLFKEQESTLVFDYIGSEGVVRSSNVTTTFGEVLIQDGCSEYLLTVYAENDGEIKKGDKVIVIKLNEKNQRYLVKKEFN